MNLTDVVNLTYPHPRTVLFDYLEVQRNRNRSVLISMAVQILVTAGYNETAMATLIARMRKEKQIEVFEGQGTRYDPFHIGLSSTAVRFIATKPFVLRTRKTKAILSNERYRAAKHLKEINATPSKVLPTLNKSIATEIARLALHENSRLPLPSLTSIASRSPLALVPERLVQGLVPQGTGFVLTWRGIPLSFAEARLMYQELGTLFGNTASS